MRRKSTGGHRGRLVLHREDCEVASVVRSIRRADKLLMEIKADTQVAKMFVEQLGRDNAKPVDVPLGFDCNHFGYGRESHKLTNEELDEWDVVLENEAVFDEETEMTTVDRSLMMRVAYMAADSADLDKFLTKMIKLAKMAQTPKECNVQRRQRSYDIQEVWRPDVIQLFERQKMPKMIECYDDSSMITFMSRCSLGPR